MSKKELPADSNLEGADAEGLSPVSERSPGMSREIKVGLAVILVLFAVFGALLANRLRRAATTAPVADEVAAKSESRAAEKPGAKELLAAPVSATPVAPTVVTAQPALTNPATSVAKFNTQAETPRWKDASYESASGASPPSFMPRLDGPGKDRVTASSEGERATPAWQGGPSLASGPSATKVQMTNSLSASTGQQPFDPFARPSGAAASGPQAGPAIDLAVPADPSPTREAKGAAGAADAFRPSPFESRSTASAAPTVGAPATPAGFAQSDSSAGLRRLDSDAGRRPDGTYVVQPNENYWAISHRLYGTGAYFRALAEHNRKRYPDENRLTVGDVIAAPAAAELERMYPALCPKSDHRRVALDRSVVSSASVRAGGRVYVVQEGDNLFNIAKYELGKAARWVEIYELNRELLGTQVDRLTPGMKLTLPEGPPPARTAVQGPDSGLRR